MIFCMLYASVLLPVIILVPNIHMFALFNRTKANHLQLALRYVDNVKNQTECKKVVYLDVGLNHERWKREALLVLEVANLMTSLWPLKRTDNSSVAEVDDFLYRSVRSIIMFSPQSFGAVICFDRNQYKNYFLFCPYAYKSPDRNNSVTVFDIAAQQGGYDYTKDEDAIWWRDTRTKALTLKPIHQTEFYAVRFNASALENEKSYTVPVVSYSDGVWTRPYYDCFGGKIWMVTYLAPFFNEKNHFLGVVSIDIQLMDIDINQCDKSETTDKQYKNKQSQTESTDDTKLVEFLGTHRCHKPSTKCVHIPHQGFKRGSYTCHCKKGYYFPKPKSESKHFNGEQVEAAYDAMLEGKSRSYPRDFECLPCSEGCSECMDGRPCIFSKNILFWILMASIHGIILVVSLGFGVAVCCFRKHKVIKASSPRFLVISILGVTIMFIKPCVMLVGPTHILCVTEQWLHHIGFAIAYCSIIIKTWRVAVIFRVRSAQRIALTDSVLMRRFLLIIMGFVIYMLLWTNISPPYVSQWKTMNGLIFERCTFNTWLEIIAILGDCGLLTWGMWVCYQVRNAPSAYNESKFVSWAIYNAMFVTCFSAVLRFTLRNSTNPDIMFLLELVFIHASATTMLLLIAIHKLKHFWKSQQQVKNDITSINNAASQNIIDRIIDTDCGKPVTIEREDLRGEIERLANKVAVLQSKLMEERNKHVKNDCQTTRRPSRIMRLGFGLRVISKQDEDDQEDVNSIGPDTSVSGANSEEPNVNIVPVVNKESLVSITLPKVYT